MLSGTLNAGAIVIGKQNQAKRRQTTKTTESQHTNDKANQVTIEMNMWMWSNENSMWSNENPMWSMKTQCSLFKPSNPQRVWHAYKKWCAPPQSHCAKQKRKLSKQIKTMTAREPWQYFHGVSGNHSCQLLIWKFRTTWPRPFPSRPFHVGIRWCDNLRSIWIPFQISKTGLPFRSGLLRWS